MAKKLVPVNCKKCGKLLVTTLPGAKVYCPKCRSWTKGRNANQGTAGKNVPFAAPSNRNNGNNRNNNRNNGNSRDKEHKNRDT